MHFATFHVLSVKRKVLQDEKWKWLSTKLLIDKVILNQLETSESYRREMNVVVFHETLYAKLKHQIPHTRTPTHTQKAAKPFVAVLAWSRLPSEPDLCATQVLGVSTGKSSW